MSLSSLLRAKTYFTERLVSQRFSKHIATAIATAEMFVMATQCGIEPEEREHAVKEQLYWPYHLFVRDLFFATFWDEERTANRIEEKEVRKEENEERMTRLFFVLDESRKEAKTRRRIAKLSREGIVEEEFKLLLYDMGDSLTRMREKKQPDSIEDATTLLKGFGEIQRYLANYKVSKNTKDNKPIINKNEKRNSRRTATLEIKFNQPNFYAFPSEDEHQRRKCSKKWNRTILLPSKSHKKAKRKQCQ